MSSFINSLFRPKRTAKKCNLCDWHGKDFVSVNYPGKPGPVKQCPKCKQLERHRLAYYLLKDKLGTGLNTLHIAPEVRISEWLMSISSDYLSVDINSPRAMRSMDITNLDLDDKTFSFICCSHVLEHIEDDIKAMSELFRVLKPGGTALIQIPVYGKTTYEDSTITSPERRLEHFKDKDHVRLYGIDITERLSSVGFDVQVLDLSEIPPEDINVYELSYPSTKEIFMCRRL